MKNFKYYFLTLAVLASFAGCEFIGGPAPSDEVATNPYRVDEDCPYIEGAEMTEWQNNVTGWLGAEEDPVQRVFTYDHSYGLRCYYRYIDAEPMNLSLLGGTVDGYFSYIYEMEVRKFDIKSLFDEFIRLDSATSYCNPDYAEMGAFVIGKLSAVHKNAGFGDMDAAHFGCSWKAENLDGGSVRINQNRVVDIIMDYPNVITLSIVKRVGNHTRDGYPWMDMTTEDLIEQALEIDHAIYETEEFKTMPVDLELRLLKDLMEIAKKPREE